MVSKVTCDEKYVLEGNGPKVALMDFGAKKNIAKSLNERGCEVTVYPAGTKAEEIICCKSGRHYACLTDLEIRRNVRIYYRRDQEVIRY